METINKELLKGSTVTLVLTVLNRREMYGYELIKSIEAASKGSLQLKEGTLYPILHQLEHEGAIAARWEGEENTRQRKYYRITRAGKKLLADKTKEWVSFRSIVDQILAGQRSWIGS